MYDIIYNFLVNLLFNTEDPEALVLASNLTLISLALMWFFLVLLLIWTYKGIRYGLWSRGRWYD